LTPRLRVIQKLASIDLQTLALEVLLPHPRNPREHPKPGSVVWEVLKKSLEFDYFDPLIWNKRNGFLVGGHLRVKLLAELGYTHAHVSVVDYEEAVHYARMIAANRPLGEWIDAILSSLAGDIEMAGIDAALACYDHKGLMAIVQAPEAESDDENAADLTSKADQLQQKWEVKDGDLYQIGPHRLLCGDCSSLDNWERLLEGGKADLLWCDPPYNVAYDQAQRKRSKLQASGDKETEVKSVTILNDDHPTAKYFELLKSWISAGSQVLKPGGAFYVAHAESYSLETRLAVRENGLHLAQCLIWVKQGWTLTRQDYQWQHEPILYGWRPGAGHFWQGGYSQSTIIDDSVALNKLTKGELIGLVNHLRNAMETTVIREPKNNVSDMHPTMKPVRLVARQIWNSSRRGETVAELFGGSGTTLVAAEQLGRRCVATEMDPKYCAVILERLSALGLSTMKINGSV
jgi:DNA modification methylase